MSFDEANELRGNPHYSEDRAYRVNCQTCVVANELRRRGFDVETLPNIKGSKLEMLSQHTEMAWIDEIGNVPKSHIAGGAYNPRVSNTGRVIYSYKTGLQMMNEFDAMTQDAGRYHVKWHWKKKQSSHIITFERRTDGSYLFYDPQTGIKGTSLMPWNTKEIDTKRGLRVLRVDNLRVNPQLAKDVLTKPNGKALKGIVGESGIAKLPNEKRREIMQHTRNWVQSNIPQTTLPDGNVSHRATVQNAQGKEIIVNLASFNEIYSKNINRNNLYEVLTVAQDFSSWIPRAKFIRTEAGIHHQFNFNVYEVTVNGKRIEFKTKLTDAEYLYNLRFT